MKSAMLILAIISISACVPIAPRSITAQQNLNAAQVQATNAALDDQAVMSATAQAQQRQADAIAYATEQARMATAQAASATEQAAQAAYSATEQANAIAASQLSLEQQQISLETAKKSYAATSQALDQRMKLDSAAATRDAGQIRATSTAVAKALAGSDGQRERERTEADLIFWIGWFIKIGIALAFLVGVFTVVEIIRKRGSVMMVGKIPVSVDGSFVGTIYVTPLLEAVPQPPLLAAPQATEQGENGNGKFTVNGTHVVESMSQQEFDDRQYWRTRTMRFLQAAMEATSPDNNRIPRFDKVGIKAADWVDTTDALGKWIDKQERQPTYCLPPYESLTKLHDAIATKKIVPLPPYLRAKYNENSGKQETGEQRKTGETEAKTAGNRAVSPLDEAVMNLPGVAR